jgi:hypothetical protein
MKNIVHDHLHSNNFHCNYYFNLKLLYNINNNNKNNFYNYTIQNFVERIVWKIKRDSPF